MNRRITGVENQRVNTGEGEEEGTPKDTFLLTVLAAQFNVCVLLSILFNLFIYLLYIVLYTFIHLN